MPRAHPKPTSLRQALQLDRLAPQWGGLELNATPERRVTDERMATDWPVSLASLLSDELNTVVLVVYCPLRMFQGKYEYSIRYPEGEKTRSKQLLHHSSATYNPGPKRPTSCSLAHRPQGRGPCPSI
ncbi:hypothetical protein SEVIR_2G400732v4 [Setaria viridis]